MTIGTDTQIFKNKRLCIIDRIKELRIFTSRIWLETMNFFYIINAIILWSIDRRTGLFHRVIAGSGAKLNIWKINRYNIAIIFKDLLCGSCGSCASCCGHYYLAVGLLAGWLSGLLLAFRLSGWLVVGLLALNLFYAQLILLIWFINFYSIYIFLEHIFLRLC